MTHIFAFRMIGLIWAVSFWLNVTAQSDIRCPTGCRCIMKTVRCSRAGLTHVPPDLPQFAEVIDLRRVFKFKSVSHSVYKVPFRVEEL